MEIQLIRHGMTEGNKKRRYIGGRTEEGLAEEGIRELKKRILQGYYKKEPGTIYISPMKRCKQTAELIYPKHFFCVEEGFRECDFGLFENKSYEELNGNPLYQRWVDSGGKMAFPEGEEPEAFKERAICTFKKILEQEIEKNTERVTCIVHGGIIMSIMERYAKEKKSFYDYNPANGEAICLIVHSTYSS